mgnify:CR=1 FL=1
MFWALLLILVATGLERLTRRPFLATRFGALFALALGGERLGAHLYRVPDVPAVGFRAAAQTWGETVLVTEHALNRASTTRLLAHEACHVRQYRRLTSFGFWLLYVVQWVRGLVGTRNAFQAYLDIPLEREARADEPLNGDGL